MCLSVDRRRHARSSWQTENISTSHSEAIKRKDVRDANIAKITLSGPSYVRLQLFSGRKRKRRRRPRRRKKGMNGEKGLHNQYGVKEETQKSRKSGDSRTLNPDSGTRAYVLFRILNYLFPLIWLYLFRFRQPASAFHSRPTPISFDFIFPASFPCFVAVPLLLCPRPPSICAYLRLHRRPRIVKIVLLRSEHTHTHTRHNPENKYAQRATPRHTPLHLLINFKLDVL